jgi:hypothetical protein
VPACDGVGAQATVVHLDQVLTDLAARGVARCGSLGQAYPGPDEQRLHRSDGDAERGGEIGVGHPGQLAHEEGGTLLLWQPADVLDEAAQRLPQVDLGERILRGSTDELENLRRGRGRPTELVYAAVVGDAEQPRPQRQLPVGSPEPRVGADEYVLKGILGVLTSRQHLAGVGEQALVVALVDDPEGVVVSGPEESDELLVGAEAEQRRRERDPGVR